LETPASAGAGAPCGSGRRYAPSVPASRAERHRRLVAHPVPISSTLASVRPLRASSVMPQRCVAGDGLPETSGSELSS
jgi:hypothetical protein